MKTRAFDPETKQWRTDYVVTLDNKICMMTAGKDFFLDKSVILVEQPDWILSHFTGHLDNCGDEIYEHHVVVIGDVKYVVKWDKSGFGLDQITVIPNPFGDLRVLPSLHRHLDETTIIGDVFQNPELLEVVP